MSASDLADLRVLAEENQNALLFAAEDTLNPSNSVNLNVTIGEASSRTTFADLTEAQVDELARALCARFEAEASSAGGRGQCQGHDVQLVAGRSAMVLRQSWTMPSRGVDNLRTVLMLPGDGYLLTLSLSLSEDQPDTGLAARVIESVRMPARG